MGKLKEVDNKPRKVCIIKMYVDDYYLNQDDYDSEHIRKSLGDTGFTEVSAQDFYYLKDNLCWLNQNNKEPKTRYDLYELLDKKDFELKVDEIREYIKKEKIRQENDELEREKQAKRRAKERADRKEEKLRLKQLLGNLTKEEIEKLAKEKGI